MKESQPESLRICLVGQRFQVLSRSTDHGFLWPMARGLSRMGHSVTILSTRSRLGKVEVQREGVTAYYLKEAHSPYSGQEFSDAAYQKFLELHRENPFHLVHSLDDSGRKIGRNKKNLGVAMAYDVEATQMSQLFSILGMSQDTASSILRTYFLLAYKFLLTYLSRDRKILRGADGIFVSHPLQRVILERYYLYPDFHIYSVPYGAELSPPTGQENLQEIRKVFNLPESAQVAVTVSDMIEAEEVIPLIKAFEKVAIKKPNAYLVIAGQGPQFKKIERIILDHALAKKVLLPGLLKDNELTDLILVSDVFVNLSGRTTGFEPHLIEAMAQKKIVIGSEISSISNVIEDQVDGFLIRPADTESLTHLLLALFLHEIDTQKMAKKAQAKVLQLFDPQKMVQSALDAYCKILKGCSHLKSPRSK